jgi:hypothetical protein
MSKLLPALLIGLLGCGETGQQRLDIPVFAQGSQRDMLAVGDARFTLQRAEIGFGPLYLCATDGADVELCDVALGEMLETVTVQGLMPAAQALGTLHATTGSVHSALYDYGISWLLTQQGPRPSAGAPEGHSVVLEGSLTRAEQSLRFSARLDVLPRAPGDAALNALATRRELRAGDRLTLRVDPYRWLMRINVDKLFELDQDGDGEVTLRSDTQAYQAILQGMTNGAPLALEWSP